MLLRKNLHKKFEIKVSVAEWSKAMVCKTIIAIGSNPIRDSYFFF